MTLLEKDVEVIHFHGREPHHEGEETSRRSRFEVLIDVSLPDVLVKRSKLLQNTTVVGETGCKMMTSVQIRIGMRVPPHVFMAKVEGCERGLVMDHFKHRSEFRKSFSQEL